MAEKRRKHLTPLFSPFIVLGGGASKRQNVSCLARWHHLAKLVLSLRTKQGQDWLLFGLEIPELYTRLGILNIQEEESGKPFLYCSQENHLDVSIRSSLAKGSQAKVKLDLFFPFMGLSIIIFQILDQLRILKKPWESGGIYREESASVVGGLSIHFSVHIFKKISLGMWGFSHNMQSLFYVIKMHIFWKLSLLPLWQYFGVGEVF